MTILTKIIPGCLWGGLGPRHADTLRYFGEFRGPLSIFGNHVTRRLDAFSELALGVLEIRAHLGTVAASPDTQTGMVCLRATERIRETNAIDVNHSSCSVQI